MTRLELLLIISLIWNTLWFVHIERKISDKRYKEIEDKLYYIEETVDDIEELLGKKNTEAEQ